MPPKGSTKPNHRKRRSADPAPPRRQPRPLLPGSPKARRDVNGNITNAAALSEATLALAQNRPRVLPTIPAPGPPAHSPTFRQQLAIHTRGEHVDQPDVATNVRSDCRIAPKNGVHSKRYAPYLLAPPNCLAAHSGAVYAPPAVTSPASRMNFVEPQQQHQHYPQRQVGNVLPDAGLMRFPSNSSQGTLGRGPLNAMGSPPSGNVFQERALRAEDFEQAGLNLEAVQNEESDENGGDAQLQSDFSEFQNFLLDPAGDMATTVGPANGWNSLDQMASRPIFHQYPAPATGYQQPLLEPTFAGYNIAGAYQTPDAPTMYAPQWAHFQPTFQPPGHNHVPQTESYTEPQPGALSLQLPAYSNGYPQQQPGRMYAPGPVNINNFVVQQPPPPPCTQPYQRHMPTAQP